MSWPWPDVRAGPAPDSISCGPPVPMPRRSWSRPTCAPTPPYAAGPAAARAGAHALMDVSDGLLRDAGRMADASGVSIDLAGYVLDRRAAELAVAATALGDDALALGWVLAGGEDHPLLAAFAADQALPAGFEAIGVVVESAAEAVLVDGQPASRLSAGLPTWDHFQH